MKANRILLGLSLTALLAAPFLFAHDAASAKDGKGCCANSAADKSACAMKDHDAAAKDDHACAMKDGAAHHDHAAMKEGGKHDCAMKDATAETGKHDCAMHGKEASADGKSCCASRAEGAEAMKDCPMHSAKGEPTPKS